MLRRHAAARRGTLAFALGVGLLAGCAEARDERRNLLVATLLGADAAILDTRAALVAGKYAVMADSPFRFLRGSMPLFVRDALDPAFADPGLDSLTAVPLVRSLGDAHLENFGTLRDRNGAPSLEVVDFDTADDWPYRWELERLSASLVLAAREARSTADPEASPDTGLDRDVASTCAGAYIQAIRAYAAGAPLDGIDTPYGKVIEDAFERAKKGAIERGELQDWTTDATTPRQLLRGEFDDGAEALVSLPAFAVRELPNVLDAYHRSLIGPPPREHFTLLDAARKLGDGVGSFPKLRVYLLVRGPTDAPDDDLLLEVKELTESGAPVLGPQRTRSSSPHERVLGTARRAWLGDDVDVLRGTSRWLGMDVQLRPIADADRTLRVRRLTGKRAEPEALGALAKQLGQLLARIHASGAVAGARAVADHAGAPEAFVAAATRAATTYADRVEADHALFVRVLAEDGPLLGYTPRNSAPPLPPELQALWEMTP